MSRLDEFMKLTKQVEKAQQTANKAEGALGQVMKELNSEFNCDSIDVAEQKRKQLRKQVEKSKNAFDTGLKKFKRDWSEELAQLDDELENED